MADGNTVARTAYVMPAADKAELFACSACGRTLHEPTLLGSCLHSICRKCLDDLLARQTIGGTGDSNGNSMVSNGSAVTGVACPKCGAVNVGCHPRFNHFLDSLACALGVVRRDAECDLCLEDGLTGQLADQWCADCRKYVCVPCSAWHTKFNRAHATQPLTGTAVEAADGLVPAGSPQCDTCSVNGSTGTAAESWCSRCCIAMCSSCSTWHDRFHRTHERTALLPGDTIVRPSASSSATSVGAVVAKCRQHGAKHEYFCDECSGLKCTDCAKLCLESAHTMHAIDGPQAEELARGAVDDLRSARGNLHAVVGDLQKRASILVELDRALTADRETLLDNRRLALDAVSRAFELVEQEVVRHHDELRLRVSAFSGSGGADAAWSSLRARLDHALTYSRALLQTADAPLVLDQSALVLSGLRSLTHLASSRAGEDSYEPRRIVRPVDGALIDGVVRQLTGRTSEPPVVSQARHAAAAAATCGDGELSRQPSCTGLTLNSALGSDISTQECTRPDSAAATSDVGSSVVTVNSIDEGATQLLPAAGPAASRELVRSSTESAVGASGIVSLPAASCTFSVQGDCRDITATPDGRILLAALKKGVRQYDAAGRKLRSWRPPKRDGRDKGCVSTVEALSDGRVAVGIINHSLVVLLRRVDVEAWSEDARIVLHSQPYRLAAHGDRLVVAGARITESRQSAGLLAVVVNSKCGPGPDIDLVSTTDGSVLRSHKLDYDVISVTLTGAAVVVASSERQRAKGSGHWCYVVDAFDHQGAVLWRHESEEEVYDFCPSPVATYDRVGHSSGAAAAAVIYVVLPESRRVVALDAVTGCWLVDAYRASREAAQAKPVRLAASHTGQRPLMAILYLDDNVSVHHFDT